MVSNLIKPVRRECLLGCQYMCMAFSLYLNIEIYMPSKGTNHIQGWVDHEQNKLKIA